jgi:hypothetical protein
MKNSLIQLAESIPVREQKFPGPSVIHLFRFNHRLRASVAPGVGLILGSCLPAYDHDLEIEGWMERVGGFRTLGFELSPSFSLGLYWDTARWNRPGVGARRNRMYFVQIERPSRETWLWTSEPIARRLFAEAFGMVPNTKSPTASPQAAAENPPRQAISRTSAVMQPLQDAPIVTSGWTFEAVSATCLN